jgi:hypothetical protein
MLAASGIAETMGENAEVRLSSYNLKFVPPSGWCRYAASEIFNIYPTDSENFRDDGETRDETTAPTPILGFTRVPEPVIPFNPQIFLYCDLVGQVSKQDLLDAARFCHDDFYKIARDPLTLLSPRYHRLNAFDSTEAQIRFRFEAPDGLVSQLTRHVEIFTHQGMVYLLMMTNETRCGLLPEQTAFMQSLAPIRNVNGKQ